LRDLATHRVCHHFDRAADYLKCGTGVARIPRDIVSARRSIGIARTAKIEKMNRERFEIEPFDDLVEHAARADPAVKEQEHAWTRSACLQGERESVVIDVAHD